MKYAIVSTLVATTLFLGACSHMAETAVRAPVPATSLTGDEIRTELAAISRQMDWAPDRIAARQHNARSTQFITRAVQEPGVPPPTFIANTTAESLPHRGRMEALAKRRFELLSQLAEINPSQSTR